MMKFSNGASASRLPFGGKGRVGSLPLLIFVAVCGLLVWLTGEFGRKSYANAKYVFDVHSGEGGLLRKNIPPQCKGKERVLEILDRATEFAVDKKCHSSVTSVLAAASVSTTRRNTKDKGGKSQQQKSQHVYGKTTCNIHDICNQLPLWKQVAHLYGDKPVVLGMETCVQYREMLQQQQTKNNATAAVRVAGLYNSGTNALAAILADNLPQFNHNNNAATVAGISSSWEVPWGKHGPAKSREASMSTTTTTNEQVFLPIVVVRDPFRWMASMVRASAGA
jgi:hypothetical protein